MALGFYIGFSRPVLAVVVGVVVGLICRQFSPTEETIRLVKFPGELFLRMLRMLMLPLIIASMITGLGNLKGAVAGRIGVLSMLYYMATTVIALLVALALVHTIKPGSNSRTITTGITQAQEAKTSGADMILDAISLIAILGSIGAAGVPGTGITALLLVLNAVGIPDTGMSYLLTIDWLTDRIRTSVNVAGDCLAVGIVSHFTLEEMVKSNIRSPEKQDEDSDADANENEIIVL
ncbi:putative sodium-dependent excitatory amino acid transporter glt-3 [Haliotis asinina]|uniref:putative sodium-dependent excitatory amino acid transporter glt-3 n=1 Tax=Haliotis asinina TaxID=109174 RepID=UPI00353228F4